MHLRAEEGHWLGPFGEEFKGEEGGREAGREEGNV